MNSKIEQLKVEKNAIEIYKKYGKFYECYLMEDRREGIKQARKIVREIKELIDKCEKIMPGVIINIDKEMYDDGKLKNYFVSVILPDGFDNSMEPSLENYFK